MMQLCCLQNCCIVYGGLKVVDFRLVEMLFPLNVILVVKRVFSYLQDNWMFKLTLLASGSYRRSCTVIIVTFMCFYDRIYC